MTTTSALENRSFQFLPQDLPTLPGGYMGRLLRVDLATGEIQIGSLPSERVLRQYWGGQALGTYFLLKELGIGVRPFDPESVLVLMTGPIGATGLTPGGTKLTTVFLSPATGNSLGRAATSGFWAMALKASGFDGVIVTGKAARPTYLYVDNGHAELRDASSVWGRGTRETEDMLRQESKHQDVRIACIGPAGENRVHGAMLVNDYNHNAAHGVGAVMGSKNLKAIVARGSMRPPIHDRKRLLQAGARWRKTLLPLTQTTERKRGPGAIASSWGTITKNNWRSTILTDETRGFDKNRIVLRPCFACPRMCPWDVEIGEGPHKGKLLHRAPGTETLDAFYNLGIGGNDNLYLTERMDDLGIECGHFSNTAALAFEAWEKGLLGPDRTEGMELTWGNVAAADRLLDMCARREGWLGNLMADGPRELAEGLGGDALQWAVHVKGGTPGQHDWRPSPAFMIRELVASGGMKSQGGGSGVMDFVPSPDLQYREKWGPLDPTKPEGWARNHLVSEQFKQFVGCMGACWFAMNNMAPDGLNSMVDSLAATTGWDLTLDDALDMGHRSMLLQSIFASQRGWKAEDDWKDVGPRFLEPIPDGKYQGFTIARWLPDIIEEYHRLAGRHPVTGRPLRATLQSLGMDEFAEWSEPT